MIKILNLKIGDNLKISKYKNSLAKCNVPIRFEHVFVVKKVEHTVPWTYFISDLKDGEIAGKFAGKNCKKHIKKSLELKRVINYNLNEKNMIIRLIAGQIKKTQYK